MTMRKFLLWAVLIDFALYSTWAMWDVGYLGIWQAGLQSKAALQILFDLSISCSLIGLWLIDDARRRGVRAWPWLVGIVFLGSLASLCYLLAREYAGAERLRGAQPAA